MYAKTFSKVKILYVLFSYISMQNHTYELTFEIWAKLDFPPIGFAIWTKFVQMIATKITLRRLIFLLVLGHSQSSWNHKTKFKFTKWMDNFCKSTTLSIPFVLVTLVRCLNGLISYCSYLNVTLVPPWFFK